MSETTGPAFDEVLAAAMQHVDVPAETTAKLYALAQPAEHAQPAEQHSAGGLRLVKPASTGRLLRMPAPKVWMSGAIAAALVMGCALGGLHVQHEREASKATADFELSQRITEQALAETRLHLQQQGISLEQ